MCICNVVMPCCFLSKLLLHTDSYQIMIIFYHGSYRRDNHSVLTGINYDQVTYLDWNIIVVHCFTNISLMINAGCYKFYILLCYTWTTLTWLNLEKPPTWKKTDVFIFVLFSISLDLKRNQLLILLCDTKAILSIYHKKLFKVT